MPVGLWAVFAALAAGYLLAGVVVLAFGIETRGMMLEDAALETASDVQTAAPSRLAVPAGAGQTAGRSC